MVTISSAGAAPGPAPGTGSAALPRLQWGSCASEVKAWGLPVRHRHRATGLRPPKRRQITLAPARLPASSPSRKLGSIFLNPGGPGGSGVDFLFQVGPFLFSDEVRARFDLVGLDPRGIMRSTPLRCYEPLDEALADLAPMAFPVTRAEERVWSRPTAPWPRPAPSAAARS